MENKNNYSIENFYKEFIKKKKFILVILIALTLFTMMFSISIGSMKFTFKQVLVAIFGDIFGLQSEEMTQYVILSIRFPRVMLAVISGMALGAAGAVMQGILRNPLASPYTLGVSSGAAFGAAIAIVMGKSIFGLKLVQTSPFLIAFNAFVFGAFSLALVYLIGKIKGATTTILLLSGVAVGSLFSAGISVLKYFSNNEALRNLDLWLMGGFWGANLKNIKILSPVILLCFIILIKYSSDINALSMGEDIAKTLGVNVKRTILLTLITVTFMASATIAFSGVIGFVGLIAPHISRNILGSDNKYLIIGSAFVGALLLLLSDTLARTIISPIEIPVGIVTSLIGAPFFIYILVKKDKKHWE
ncbi:FecCD family ABC transporter permease [Clostridium amazonitimonense]|uniref:FecCD family ABC transporter permease n=1 Tax=Clostridium amazonitimonense TaxID=1499689 RepID=UPI000509D4C0|nr:iron ABC transporter permease [Clostridium amazonitimonense]